MIGTLRQIILNHLSLMGPGGTASGSGPGQ